MSKLNNGTIRVIGSQLYLDTGKQLSVIPAQAFHRYWREPDEENVVVDYEEEDGRSFELVKLIEKYCSKNDEIFEPGCSVGRNLHYLYKAGFTKLRGVDINKDALRIGDEVFPDTVAHIPRVCSSLEDYLVDFYGTCSDVTVSMGFFMHIHPSSEWIFQVTANLTRKFIITVEEESGFNVRVIPRNYKTIFERFGMEQLEEKYHEFENTMDNTGKIKLTYRVFRR